MEKKMINDKKWYKKFIFVIYGIKMNKQILTFGDMLIEKYVLLFWISTWYKQCIIHYLQITWRVVEQLKN